MYSIMVPESSKSRLNTRSNCGFTLIELLVVVSIITLLIAIMLPALSKARRLTKRIICTSNLRQIASAWHVYLDNNGGKFLQGMYADWLYGGWKGTSSPFPDANKPLNKYLGLMDSPQSESQAKVFYCPADDTGTGEKFYGLLGTSYKTNMLLVGNVVVAGLPTGALRNAINARLGNLNLDRVYGPSSLLLIGDYHWQSQWLPTPYPFGIPWHGRCCHFNMAFLDGHVKFIKIYKGLHITDEYRTIPFKDLYGLAQQEQVWEPCPKCD